MAYERKTVDVYNLHVDYGYGFEIVTSESTRKEIIERKKEYLANEKGIKRIKFTKNREKKNV